ncbi:type I-E CRISPR-associated protein Cse1/CasA [Streptomyces odonnellii]|uniref:type I-E CRISPR-associated protein Cse1/CasA n=1 Tax=Streptomyces odonnellii TaxID=1417980 RepID=UPI000624FEFE|nr:type I-E CRISPR-associated protein Cse1/CasA [Streptomyces odonnellii]
MSQDPVGDDRFPLDTRPWIPVFASGATTRVGLRELFLRAHEFEGLAIALPPAASGLMRILSAMAARITRLYYAVDSDEWFDRRYELLEDGARFGSDAVHEYFDRYADGLRLHDPVRPFLQDPRLNAECSGSSGVNKLVMARPAGNNQVFFGHFTDAEQVALAPEEAVLHLIAQLYYGPSGQCTPRTVEGQRYGNTMAGPLRRVLSCHPVGRTLYETLMLGILEPGTWPQVSDRSNDACPWERTELPTPLAPPTPATGPLSMLTEQYQHAVLLQPGPDKASVTDATITWALRHNRPACRDPYLIWDEKKDGDLYPRDAKAERALWRDLDALVLLSRSGGGRRPLIFEGLAGDQLPEPVFHALRVVAYGFDQDGQTRDRTYFTATTPPLFALLNSSRTAEDSALARGAKEAREAAEKAAWHLATALRTAWRSYTTPFADDRPADRSGGAQGRTSGLSGAGKKDKGMGPWPEAALADYWPAAEERFWELLDSGGFSLALPAFGRIALRAFDDVTAPVAAQPRGAKARENARGLVRSLLDHGRGR